jgi:hypothetical protein
MRGTKRPSSGWQISYMVSRLATKPTARGSRKYGVSSQLTGDGQDTLTKWCLLRIDIFLFTTHGRRSGHSHKKWRPIARFVLQPRITFIHKPCNSAVVLQIGFHGGMHLSTLYAATSFIC